MDFSQIKDAIKDKDYTLVRDILINEPYNLQVKAFDNFFIVSSTLSNIANSIRDSNGIIVNNNKLEVICFSIPKQV